MVGSKFNKNIIYEYRKYIYEFNQKVFMILFNQKRFGLFHNIPKFLKFVPNLHLNNLDK